MLTTIIQKEIRDIIGSTKFAVIFGACAALILLSFYVGAQTFRANQSQYEAAKAENLRQYEGLTDWFNVQSHRIFLPPQPLACLVTGVSNDIGRTTEVWGRGELAATDSKFNEDPIFAIFRFLDLEFLFQIVLSLFAILLGYDAISGERERGTLKLSFSNAVPRYQYILGKLIGTSGSLTLPLLLAIAIGCLLLPVIGVPMASSDWLRLGLVIAVGLVYFLVFLTLSIMVSALTERSASSFLVLLAVWIFCVLIIPRASVVIAGRAVDVPTVDEIGAQKMRFQAQQWEEERANWQNFRPSEKGDPEATMAELNRFMEQAADEREKKLAEFSGRLNEQRFNRQSEQQRVALSLARVSPAASLSLGITNLAGTSIDLKQHYKDEATSYQDTYAGFIRSKTGVVPGGRMFVFRSVVDDAEEPEPINPQEIPEFVYRQPTLTESLAAATTDIGLLVLFGLVFCGGAFAAFQRYDVR